MSDNTKRYDLAQIRSAIAALFQPGQIVEVRMMNKKKKITATGWYDDYDIMAKHIAKLARDGFGEGHKFIQENVYWTVNPVHEGLLAREIKNDVHFAEDTTSDINILSRCWIPVDIDPLRPSGVSATKEEKALAKAVTVRLAEQLLEIGFPKSSLVLGMSGNGYHILIRCDLPNDNDSLLLVKQCLAALQLLAGTDQVDIDQKVCNAARIIKCYGTMSCKGVDTEDRPWRMMNVAWVARQFSDNQHMLRMKFGMKTTIDKKQHTTRYRFPRLSGTGGFVDHVALARADASLVDDLKV